MPKGGVSLSPFLTGFLLLGLGPTQMVGGYLASTLNQDAHANWRIPQRAGSPVQQFVVPKESMKLQMVVQPPPNLEFCREVETTPTTPRILCGSNSMFDIYIYIYIYTPITPLAAIGLDLQPLILVEHVHFPINPNTKKSPMRQVLMVLSSFVFRSSVLFCPRTGSPFQGLPNKSLLGVSRRKRELFSTALELACPKLSLGHFGVCQALFVFIQGSFIICVFASK